MKSLTSNKPYKVYSIYLFITGGAGAGKSHLIKAMHKTACKTFKHGCETMENPSVLLLAPTGVAAIHIGGNTIHSGLGISREIFGDYLTPLPDERKTVMRAKLSNLKLVIIDEISMVSNILFKHIHERLKEIFCTSETVWFGGVSVVVVGDLYQLPPVRSWPIFLPFKDVLFNLSHPWEQFRMVELTEIMHQRDDRSFTDILNRVRIGNLDENDIEQLLKRRIEKSDENYPCDVLHIWAENKPAAEYNQQMLMSLDSPLVTLVAQDEYPPKASEQDIQKVLCKCWNETGGLDHIINIIKNMLKSC